MPTIVAIRHQFDALPEEVQIHLGKLKPLLDSSEIQIALSYLFMLIEQGRYRALKCVLVRKFRCRAQIVDSRLEGYEFSRKSFRSIINSVLQIDVGVGDYQVLAAAEKIRDKIVHGRRPTAQETRQALEDGLEFVTIFGEAVRQRTGKNPFGNLQGLTSTMKMLNEEQSLWIIRGVLLSDKVSAH